MAKKYKREETASVKIRRSVYDEMVDFSELTGWSQTDIASTAIKQYMAVIRPNVDKQEAVE